MKKNTNNQANKGKIPKMGKVYQNGTVSQNGKRGFETSLTQSLKPSEKQLLNFAINLKESKLLPQQIRCLILLSYSHEPLSKKFLRVSIGNDEGQFVRTHQTMTDAGYIETENRGSHLYYKLTQQGHNKLKEVFYTFPIPTPQYLQVQAIN